MSRLPRWVIPHRTEKLTDLYELGQELGDGKSATTYLCIDKSTGEKYACKSIPKRKLVWLQDYEDVWREIQIMHHLAGKEEVVKIRGSYEDEAAVHIVMELCSGGELFDRIEKKGFYGERDAARLIKVVVRMVDGCHRVGVMHRDLKPENFLFVGEDEDSMLKAADFGLSVFYKPGEKFKELVGSPYYVAPEVLRRSYGPEADVWSAGVILYILLSGVPPFWEETKEGIYREILQGSLDLESEPWPNISENAKDLIRNMLNRDPNTRFTSHDVLCHPWILANTVAPESPLDSAAMSRLKKFTAMNKLKKMTLRFIAEKMSKEHIAGLLDILKVLNMDSETIRIDVLKNTLKNVAGRMMESEIQALMDAADLDKNGTTDCYEFLEAINVKKMEENLLSTFALHEKDGSGHMAIDELQKACQELDLNDIHLDEMIGEIHKDGNNEGQKNYNAFNAVKLCSSNREKNRYE